MYCQEVKGITGEGTLLKVKAGGNVSPEMDLTDKSGRK